jgi:elongation factor G
MITGTDALPDNRALVSGKVPLQELQGYHSRLKSLTGGDGSFTMDFSHYAEIPANELKQIQAEAEEA